MAASPFAPLRTLKAFAQQIKGDERAGYAPSCEANAVVDFSALVEACLYAAIQYGYEIRAEERAKEIQRRKTRRQASASTR